MGNKQNINEKREGFACVIQMAGLYKKKRNSLNPRSLLFVILLVFLVLFLFLMALNWVPPLTGTLKVNVHGAAFVHPVPSVNTTGIGEILQTSNRGMVNYICGVIPGLSPLGAQLRDVQVGLRLSFIESAQSFILETDNMQAFGVIQFTHLHQHPELDDLIHQILSGLGILTGPTLFVLFTLLEAL